MERLEKNNNGKERKMRKIIIAILVVCVLGLVVSAGYAAKEGAKRGNRGNEFRKRIRYLFEKFDANSDGKITADEMSEKPQLFARLDKNDDGTVTRREALKSARERRAKHAKGARRRVRRLMEKLDTNGDRELSRDEMAERPRLFEKMDADENGVVTAREAGKFFLKHHRRKGKGPRPDHPEEETDQSNNLREGR